MNDFIYTPPSEQLKQKTTLAVKFSNDVFLMESFLKQRNIVYDEKELENTPYGRCLRIKNDLKK